MKSFLFVLSLLILSNISWASTPSECRLPYVYDNTESIYKASQKKVAVLFPSVDDQQAALIKADAGADPKVLIQPLSFRNVVHEKSNLVLLTDVENQARLDAITAKYKSLAPVGETVWRSGDSSGFAVETADTDYAVSSAEFILKFKDGTTDDQIAAFAAKYGLKLVSAGDPKFEKGIYYAAREGQPTAAGFGDLDDCNFTGSVGRAEDSGILEFMDPNFIEMTKQI